MEDAESARMLVVLILSAQPYFLLGNTAVQNCNCALALPGCLIPGAKSTPELYWIPGAICTPTEMDAILRTAFGKENNENNVSNDLK